MTTQTSALSTIESPTMSDPYSFDIGKLYGILLTFTITRLAFIATSDLYLKEVAVHAHVWESPSSS